MSSPVKHIKIPNGSHTKPGASPLKSPDIVGSPPPSSNFNYEEQQNDEIEALRAIFPEGFEDIETPKAWSKKAEKSFRLKLFAESDPSTSLVLTAIFTSTYPKSLPKLSLSRHESLSDKTLGLVKVIVETKPRQLAGEVMMLEIATDVRDILEDAVQARIAGASLPSLEEERASREVAAEQERKQAEQAELKRQALAREEEERMIQQMMEGEVKRREAAWKKRGVDDESGDAVQDEYAENAIVFDQDIRPHNGLSDEQSFRAVLPVRSLGKGPVTEVLEVHSMQPRGSATRGPTTTCLVVKRAALAQSKAKKSILDLEDELEKLKCLRHQGILNVLDFKITHQNDTWQFDVLTELGGTTSVADMLETVDTLPVYRARSYAIETLSALDFYHRNGIIHGRIHLGNIILCRSSTGSMTVKLADAGFQQKIHIIKVDSKDKIQDRARLVRQNSTFTAWQCPEQAASVPEPKSRKSDIWDFGVAFAQMVLGVEVPERYSNAQTFVNSAGLTQPFHDMMRDLLRSEPRKRPNAFDVIPCEFLRTDVGVLRQEPVQQPATPMTATRHRSFQRSISHEEGTAPGASSSSRYFGEWDEAGRLGKGGYGEVVKARNKLDGRIYAVKKIAGKTPAQLSEVLSEVYLLATLNHPYVVRYYTAWPEDELPTVSEEGSSTASAVEEQSVQSRTGDPSMFEYGQSTGGLDFISSSGYPKIEFGDDSDDSNDDDDVNDSEATASDEDDEDDDIFERNGGSSSRSEKKERPHTLRYKPTTRATLYIQMEYCERRTLRDTIRNGLCEDIDETWRFMRQILEGLAHIHGHGIIHRDLKPENIFIDNTNNPKIGDFGLATSGQYHAINGHEDPNKIMSTGDMTRSIGTAMYVAPELRSTVTGNYTEKVDMYSLGIIFFEMSFPLKTGMERGQILGALRLKEHTLPPEFQTQEKQSQGDIILSLIRHKPSERPTSAELLRSGRLPVKIEDEQIRHALSSLSDPTSPYYHRMMSTLFSQSGKRTVLDRMWDTNDSAIPDSIDYTLLQSQVRERITGVFRRYAAVETSRQGLIPRSDLYTRSDVFELLDASGTLCQLPYDLILPHARLVAKKEHVLERSFTFGTVFRMSPGGGAPRTNKEADFDIVTYDSKDLALTEAEVLKCVDDMIHEFPCFAKTPMAFHVSHSGLLDLILEFCRVPSHLASATKQIVGKLGIGQWTAQKIRTELRSPDVGIPSTSIDELFRFDFRDHPERALTKLQDLFSGSPLLPKVQSILVHLTGLVEYTKRFSVRRPVYLAPLASFNAQFYRDAPMFQALFDGKKRDVLAAGGRYDALVDAHRPRTSSTSFRPPIHAMGTTIAWDRIVSAMSRFQKACAATSSSSSAFLKHPQKDSPPEAPWPLRRADALIASFDAALLRSHGVALLALLRAHAISAELAGDARAPEQLLAQYRASGHSWIVQLKHAPGDANSKPELKVRSMDRGGESTDLRTSELLAFLRTEIRERDAREGPGVAGWERERRFAPSHSVAPPISLGGESAGGEVRVLLAKKGGPKKPLKTRHVEAAQAAVSSLLESYAGGPVLSVEVPDATLERIRETRLSDAEGWRRLVQDAPVVERAYLGEIWGALREMKARVAGDGRRAFVYNFRAGGVVDFDLLL